MTIIDPQDVTAANLKPLQIKDIALIIARSWPKMDVYAQPYVEAMYQINSINDMYICDTAYSIVVYFLSNAGGYKGDVARLVKAELKARAKAYEKAKKLEGA